MSAAHPAKTYPPPWMFSIVTTPRRSPSMPAANVPISDASTNANAFASFTNTPRAWSTNAPAIPPQITIAAEDYNRMVRMIQEGHDVVIASRYQPGSRVYGLSLQRRFISYAASWLFRIVFPTQGVRDYTCGFRAYRGPVLAAAIAKHGDKIVEVEGFQCMVDFLLKLRKMNVIFGEAPMLLRYDLKLGDSKMRVVRTMRQTLLLMLKRRFNP